MNGQPTAQNNREAGADGDLPGFRNWENADHVRELAQLWNVSEDTIPHWAPPTHAMQIFRYAEQGSIKLLWIVATNPVVSMPDLERIKRILANEDLFVVVQDIFMTETAELADIVLPAATWGERTGTYQCRAIRSAGHQPPNQRSMRGRTARVAARATTAA
ncbi:MAG: nitrate reductase [Acidimicrobiales bacterium]|nr:nitrate reductase [Acidimicrobiales bacterium]